MMTVRGPLASSGLGWSIPGVSTIVKRAVEVVYPPSILYYERDAIAEHVCPKATDPRVQAAGAVAQTQPNPYAQGAGATVQAANMYCGLVQKPPAPPPPVAVKPVAVKPVAVKPPPAPPAPSYPAGSVQAYFAREKVWKVGSPPLRGLAGFGYGAVPDDLLDDPRRAIVQQQPYYRVATNERPFWLAAQYQDLGGLGATPRWTVKPISSRASGVPVVSEKEFQRLTLPWFQRTEGKVAIAVGASAVVGTLLWIVLGR